MTDMPLLAVRDLSVSINGAKIVDGLDLTVERSEIHALVGESGCGKSMTALSILGLQPAAAKIGGSVALQGTDVASLSRRAAGKLRRKTMSVIFQEPVAALNPLMKVGDQVAEALIMSTGSDRGRARSAALEVMAHVGISDPDQRYDQYPFELSGGMCQRISIAAALISRPQLLIADEPTTALDVTIQAAILDLMKALRRETGMGMVLITHDMGVVADMADRVSVMYAGRIVETGPLHEVFARPTHPYTSLLLSTIPRLVGPRKTELRTIAGTVPDIGRWPDGCRFRTRCPLADAACGALPPLVAHDASVAHLAACWHTDRLEALA
ncbi:ABC transporter ATP-binding protein [Pseudotabrizicola alkalilacus]|uniref:ABC transporter ATP-binding protein n=1 Tax=Pseudotabrizicola alkalilacus TaxID=2305252 RepID=A0A411YWN5_9RHOB|nr:ABC transporter ATP-binding protein [Pseudotabrizicola alkalilacus]RGP35188.1 ABC transporter ATP-binding protein [Pseudotabrizicola alkalilacus]